MFKNIKKSISNFANSNFPIFLVIFGAIFFIYLFFFLKNMSPYLLNNNYFTDDSFQQTYPLYEAIDPSIFRGDRLTEVMKGYLAPLHWWIHYIITIITQDPILTGHIVMIIQLFLTCFFLFFAVKHYSGATPAFLSVTWFLHTRYLVQRVTMGLPRGWAPVIFTCYFFLIANKWHKGIFILFFVGALLHPPATFMVAVAYGMYLVFKVLFSSHKEKYQKVLLCLILLSPVYLITTYNVIKKPDYLGNMVSLKEASRMVAFSRPHGRFPFLPLMPLQEEVAMFATQAFGGRFYVPKVVLKVPKVEKGPVQVLGKEFNIPKIGFEDKIIMVKPRYPSMYAFIFISFGLVCIFGLIKNKKFFPSELWFYFLSIWIVYILSRIFAFKLYVPDRHLQFPMGFFFFLFYPIAIWRIFGSNKKERSLDDKYSWKHTASFKKSWKAGLCFLLLGGIICVYSGTGLYGDANFNWHKEKKGRAYEWIKNHTDKDSLIAGHPTSVDPVPLLAQRKVFITTEMSHPFYPKYFKYTLKKIRVALKAHYAKDLKDFYEIVAPHNIDYFVFERKLFYPENLGKIRPASQKRADFKKLDGAKYFAPLRGFVQRITDRPWQEFAYRELPKEVDIEKYPFMPFKDEYMVVVDVKELKKYLDKNQK